MSAHTSSSLYIQRLCILGCGTMGTAILSGLYTSGFMQAHPDLKVVACITQSSKSDALQTQFPGIQVFVQRNVEACTWAQAVILCVKPQLASTVLKEPGMHSALQGTLLISILAGTSLSQLHSWCPQARVIRAMPNTPCKILQGMTVVACDKTKVYEEDIQFAETVFRQLGRCTYVDEKHMDAVTALSGSGPAFACVMLESLADGGVMMGLPRSISMELAAQALLGASSLVLATKDHPAQVKDAVTTPGGCTIAGLLVMEDGKIRSTLARAIQEATMVASRLGKTPSTMDLNGIDLQKGMGVE